MILLPVNAMKINQKKIDEIDALMKSIYRLIIFSRDHLDDDLLDIYLKGMHSFTELLGIKNAQMEAQNEEEALLYLKNLNVALNFVVEEITSNINFERQVQLFQLLRLVSPETNILHPNKFRQTYVQIGGYICPPPEQIPSLVSELMFNVQSIENKIIKSIYFHHELIRIHPFVDGNGRVTRIAKNWMLMYELYPPIFINDALQKKEYINTLQNSFQALEKEPLEFGPYTNNFFDQELNRLLVNTRLLYNSVNQMGLIRGEAKNK